MQKHVDALKSLNVSNETYGPRNWEIFSQNKLNDLIIEKLKEIVQLQNNVKLDNIQQREEKNIIS